MTNRTRTRVLRKSTPIGQGVEVRVSQPRGHSFVVKTVRKSNPRNDKQQAAHDIPMFMQLGKLGVPTTFDKKTGLIVQQKITGPTAYKYLREKYGRDWPKHFDKLQRRIGAKVRRRGIIPIDLHANNIMRDRHGKWHVVDVGYAEWAQEQPPAKYRSLIRRLMR